MPNHTFRELTAELASKCPFASQEVALITDNGFANTLTGKRKILSMAELTNIRLLVAWPGQWKQDVFLVTDEAIPVLNAKL